jgi:Cu2+-exporting ATPase
MSVEKIHNYSKLSDQVLLRIMASLEHNSSHPIASAFNDYYDSNLNTNKFVESPGQGVQAIINQTDYKAGNFQWCQITKDDQQIISDNTIIYLTDDSHLLAVFELNNQLRECAVEVINQLQQGHNQVSIISGDKDQAVKKIADILTLTRFYSEQSPQQKINRIHQFQQQGQATIMVGDGVNDAPVLGQSDVSISFNQGTPIARAASDIILMGNSLSGILIVLGISKKTNAVITQNIIWALIYNFSVTPLAIMGYLAPWMAAIGMSISSLIVVINARRVAKIKVVNKHNF